MKRAIYRIHYGFEFIYESIKSIHNWADEIIVVVSNEPWYKEKTIKYLGIETPIIHPENIEYHVENLSYIPKVLVHIQEFDTPKNQWGYLINNYSADYVLTMEPDMVFSNEESIDWINDKPQVIFNKQIEYWKNEFWRIPQRNRTGPVLYKSPKNIITGFSNHSSSVSNVNSPHTTLNYGFCFSPELMYYKHLLALGFSNQIGDSVPSETWYKDKWFSWTPNTINLEISAKYTHAIRKAIPI